MEFSLKIVIGESQQMLWYDKWNGQCLWKFDEDFLPYLAIRPLE